MPADLFGLEASIADIALHDQSDSGVSQPAFAEPVILLDRSEDRAGNDLYVIEPRPQKADGTDCRFAALGMPISVGRLIPLEPTQRQDDFFGSRSDVFGIELHQL